MENFSQNVNHLSRNEDEDDDVEEHELHHLQTSTSQLFRHHISFDDFSQQARDPKRLMTKPVLGLNLSISESLENMITYKLHQNKSPRLDSYSTNNMLTQQPPQIPEKLKASNIPVSQIVIGSWKWESRFEGDLVAKCYFAKKKLVWELLIERLKSKIEIQWTDVLSLSAQFHEHRFGILNVELSQPPTFYREMEPQPRKHTQWKLTSDFTNGQASVFRRHALHFSPGTLEKHYQKLLQSGNHLYQRSQVPFPSLASPFFDNVHNMNSTPTWHHNPKLNPAFQYFPHLPNPHQHHLEIHPYHESLPYHSLSSPVMDEGLSNMQTQFQIQDQSQKNISQTLLEAQVIQNGYLIDAFLGPQTSIQESMPTIIDEFRQQGSNEATIIKTMTTAAPKAKEHPLQEEVECQLVFEDEDSVAISDLFIESEYTTIEHSSQLQGCPNLTNISNSNLGKAIVLNNLVEDFYSPKSSSRDKVQISPWLT